VSLAELIPFRGRKVDPFTASLNDAADLAELDADFEAQCRQSLQEAVPTPLERLRAGTAQVLEALREQDNVHAGRLADLSQQLAREGEAKAANLSEIALIERALAELQDTPAPAQPKRKGRG